MSKMTETTIEILGKAYQIKCPTDAISSLQDAAHYLEDRMRKLRDNSGIANLDRLAVIAALNAVHQLLQIEQDKETHIQLINQRLHSLQDKLESAFVVEEI